MAIFSANGKHVNAVQLSSSYKLSLSFVTRTKELFDNGDIEVGSLDKFTKIRNKKDVVDILSLVTSTTEANIRKQWSDIEHLYKTVRNKVSDSVDVLNEIRSHVSDNSIPVSMKHILERLDKLQKRTKSGIWTRNQLKDSASVWNELTDLPKSCSFLREYVKSNIFWTSCKEIVETMFKEERKWLTCRCTEEEPFESVHVLFEEQNTDKVVIECQCFHEHDFEETLLMLKILTKEGITAYKSAWSSLITEHEKDIRVTLRLLQNVSIEDEIENAEKVLSEPVPAFIKDTLRRLMDLGRYEVTVDVIKASLNLFKIKLDRQDALYAAINAFETIKERRDENCPFSLVANSLTQVDAISQELTTETINILNALNESSLLLEFLKEILEEDIRNLIDAVDCISEQQVQESAVSALIEVKGFLHGILIKASQELNAHDFIRSLNKQTNALSSTAVKQLPTKIHECGSSLHNLKSLYGNVANRGAMTVEIVNAIIARGKFTFKLSKDGICILSVGYKHGQEKEEHLKPSLMDLRSRALLLMNTRARSNTRKISGDTLEKFVNYVDLSIEIAEICDELHQSGNIDFIKYVSTVDCIGLNSLRQKLLHKNKDWKQTLQQMRSKYYLLNFIHGPEIHTLFNFFEYDLGAEEVKTILRFIHPAIKIGTLVKEYKCVKSSENGWTNANTLDLIGKVLHFGYEGNQPIQRHFCLKSRAKKLTDIVQNRKLYVAALEENSTQVVKMVLALYLHTTHTLPEPHQVLFCTRDTTWNELELLIYRCLGSSSFTKTPQLFCIANIEMLVNELQFKLIYALKNHEKDIDFLLALICRGSSIHPYLDELNNFTSKTSFNLSDQEVRQAFQNECPMVVTVTSAVAGLGKSSKIKEYSFASSTSLATLHISGPFYKRNIIDQLSVIDTGKQDALHVDIGNVDDPLALDTFIFELIILRYVTSGFKAVSLETKYVFIEIANTINDSLQNSLNTAMYFKREHLTWKNYEDFHVSMERNSPVQVVCQYLKSFEMGTLDKKNVILNGGASVKCLEAEVCKDLLRRNFETDSELSFSIVNIFVQILADQLKKLSSSTFLKVSRILDMMGHETLPTIRSSLVRALIEASKEFSSRSIAACRSTQISTAGSEPEKIETKASVRTKASKFVDHLTQRLDGMIRWEDSNHLMFVFHNQNIQTLSPIYRDLKLVPLHIKTLFESQLKKQMHDFSLMDQNQLQTLLQRVTRTNVSGLPQAKLDLLNKEYALTPDNLLKMILIMLRVNSQVPVVIMGETGCGKTSLIRYLATMADVDFEVLSIHAGIEEDEIISVIHENNDRALLRTDKERWLFLDEINTSEHIGLINSAICSRTILGKVLSPSLVIMGACNPYKLRKQSAVSTAGLTEKVKADELSQLVYRVLPLPESMVDVVWDFGSLSDKDEEVYVGRMIDGIFPHRKDLHDLLKELLSKSQRFVRRTEDVSYCVSLRDIQRCKALIKWFLKTLPVKHPRQDHNLKSIILALSICYHSRFCKSVHREAYRQELETVFASFKVASLTEERIQQIIFEEQKDFLRRMELPAGTAKNTALQENIFVILVCLLNRIPIFLVGKPGCSKSLSMQIIRSNLRGKDSKDSFFKDLPQLYCVSFQGSESSTSDGIIKVFEKAERYQKSNSKEDVLSVVILDEIGLAEISKFNPLKVLHSLLEPDGHSQPNVAVVGISNWALDASKMNRAIHLSRPDMNEEELYQTGISISESFLETKQQSMSKWFHSYDDAVHLNYFEYTLRDIAKSYLKYTAKLRFKNFHGLRDYYSLVKYVSRRLIEAYDSTKDVNENMKKQILIEGLKRNFGGLPSESTTLFSMFQIEANREQLETVCVLKLIKDNVTDPTARHLLCVTSGESGISLIENVLRDINREEKVVIFGSHFEEDQTADYNYRILSRIIMCMEQGLILILRDLEDIYGSLYDMLNQNYTIIGGKKHCRIALGHYSNPICQVHDDFRCIVLVDEKQVDFTDPPFLNRFEKQYLNFSAVVDHDENTLIEDLQSYVNRFCRVKSCHFRPNDCFPLFGQDLIPSLVISLFRDYPDRNELQLEQLTETAMTKLLFITQPDAILRLGKNVYEDIQQRSENLIENFFKLPIHSGIWNYIENQITRLDNERQCLLTVVLTNSSVYSQTVKKNQKYEVQVEKLGTFKSEKQLSMRLQHFWFDSQAMFLFLDCSAIEDARHISLAKTIIENTRLSALKENPELVKHVYIIVHLDRRKTEKLIPLPVNFLSGWEIVLLDTIEEPEIPLPLLHKMSLYETVLKKAPLARYITEQLFWSFTTIRYQRYGRNIESLHNIIEQIKHSDDLLQVLEDLICECVVSEFVSLNTLDWNEQIAIDAYALNTSGSLMTALEEKVFSAISAPLSKLVYHLENINALSSYFYAEQNSQRRQIWERMIRDKSLLTVADTPVQTGPECYLCTAPDLILRMPLSKIVYDKIEETKDEFMEAFIFVKGKCDIVEDDEMPVQVMEELITQHETVVKDNLPDLSKFMYDSFSADYFYDFSNMLSYALTSGLREDIRIKTVQSALSQKVHLHTATPLELLVKLHATSWVYSSVLYAELQLLDICAEIFSKEENVIAMIDKFNRDLRPLKSLENILPTPISLSDRKSDLLIGENSLYSQPLYINEVIQTQDQENEISQGVCVNKEDNKTTFMEVKPAKFEKLSGNTVGETDLFLSTPEEIVVCYDPEVTSDPVETYNKNQNLFLNRTINHGSPEETRGNVGSERTTSEFPSSVSKNNSEMEEMDSQDKLVEFICLKMIPTRSCLELFKSVEDWNERVSILLAHALAVSSKPPAFHNLRFFQDLVCIMHLRLSDSNMEAVYRLGEMLQSDTGKSLNSEDCFCCICDLLLSDIRPSASETEALIAAYLNRCLAGNPESQAMIFFLRKLGEKKIVIRSFVPLKTPFHLAINLELDTDNEEENVYKSLIRDCEVALDEYPFLFALDETLRSFHRTGDDDSQLAVLVVDILEEYFDKIWTDTAKIKLNTIMEDLLSAHNIVLSGNYGLRFLCAVSCFKAFTTSFCDMIMKGNLDAMECSSITPAIQALSIVYEEHLVSVSLRRFIMKAFGRDLLPWKLYKTCKQLEKYFKFVHCLDWTDKFLDNSVEGNPLFLHAPATCKALLKAFTEKEERKREGLLADILQETENETVVLATHGAALSRFYIQRSYKQQDDSSNQVAKTLKRVAENVQMDDANLRLLTCLLGLNAFADSELELNEDTHEEHSCIAFLCCSLYAVVLSSNQRSRGCQLSLLGKCLLCPLTLKMNILRSLRAMQYQDKTSYESYEQYLCFFSCGHRIIQNKLETNIAKCPFCSEELSENCEQITEISTDYLPQNTGEAFKGQSFSPFTLKIIRLFIDMSLFGSYSLHYATSQDLEHIIDVPEVDNVSSALFKSLRDTFKALKNIMDMSNRDLYIFLQACLLQLKDLVAKNKNSIDTVEQMYEWIMQFESTIISFAANRFENVRKMVRDQSKQTGIPDDATELTVNENDECRFDERSTQLLPSVFRLRGRPSLMYLTFEVDTLNVNFKDYPFLAFVLKSLPELAITKAIFPLIQWHLATVTHIGYRFKRHEFLALTVQDFIHNDENEKVRDTLETRFNMLQRCWSVIMESQFKLNTQMERLNRTTKMKDCLLLNSNSILYQVLKNLVDIQNNFLDRSLLIGLKSNCQALKFLSKGGISVSVPSRSISEVTPSAVISYQWNKELLNFSQAELEYGSGKVVRYEFAAIEKALALELIVGKCYLLLDNNLPSVVFVDELHQGFSKLVKDVSVIVPQRELSVDIVNGLNAKRTKHPRLTAELITHVGVLIALAKKTKGDADMPVTEYVNKWKSYFTRPLPYELLPTPEHSVKLCHLVSLYGLLEELNADALVDGLKDIYRKPLDRDTEMQLIDILKCDSVTSEIILKATKRFTYRYLSAGTADCSQPLSQYLEDDTFWPIDLNDSKEKPERKHPCHLIPADLKVQHLYYMISLMEMKLKV